MNEEDYFVLQRPNEPDYRILLNEFYSLIDRGENENVYQRYLEENTVFIPREFVQNHGIHLGIVIRKVSLSSDYVPDFFYIAKSSADWNLVFVEIEKPQSKYFKDGKNELHGDFLQALDQISRWRVWFDNNSNRDSFIDSTIGQIRIPITMQSNPCFIKYVLVHGRRSEYEGNALRTGLIRSRERDDFHILSYDSLTESIRTKSPLYVGVRKKRIIGYYNQKVH